MAVSNNPLYTPTPPTVSPQNPDLANVVDWIQRELHTISIRLSDISRLQLASISAPPVTPRDGLIELADGVNWGPLRSVTAPVNASFVGYRGGSWVPMDLGKVWEATDVGFLSGQASTSGQPAIYMVNDFNDAASADILMAKSRGSGANSLNGDNLLTMIGYGTVSAVHQPSASLLFQQGGAHVGNNIPSNIIFQTSDAAGQLNHSFVFDSAGGFTTLGVVKGGFVQGFNISGAPATMSGTSGSLGAVSNFLTITPSGAFTLTLPAFTAGSWVFIKNVAAFVINSASANVVPLAGGAATAAILAAVAGRWCLLTTDGSGTWTIMAAN